MNIDIAETELSNLIKRQIENMFFIANSEKESIDKYINDALSRTEKCFKNNKNKYYWNKNPGGVHL